MKQRRARDRRRAARGARGDRPGRELGRALPPVHYLTRDRLKRVDYWVAQATADERRVRPDGDEVDELAGCRSRRPAAADLGVGRGARSARWRRRRSTTAPLILVRHGCRGLPAGMEGRRRPTAPRRQAARPRRRPRRVLPAYRPEVAGQLAQLRCVQTLQPYAERGTIGRARCRRARTTHKTPALVTELRPPAARCSQPRQGPARPDPHRSTRRRTCSCARGQFAVLHRLGGRIVERGCVYHRPDTGSPRIGGSRHAMPVSPVIVVS